jgi:hypothetical protein
MADGGIDRKMEERMEFTTSKEVEIGKAEPLSIAPGREKATSLALDRCDKA